MIQDLPNISIPVPKIIDGFDRLTQRIQLFFAAVTEKAYQPDFEPAKASSRPLNVMLADDDADDREMLEEIILKIDPGTTLTSCHDGSQLMDRLQQNSIPDFIFLDLNMPGKDGMETLAALRSHALYDKAIIVIYSTSANQKDIQESYKMGATLYLIKPTSYIELSQCISNILSKDIEGNRPALKEYIVNPRSH